MFLSSASQWPGYVWHQRLPDRTFPLLHLVDFSPWKLSAELLISYIGMYDKLPFFIHCRLLSGVRDTAFDRWRGKIMLKNFLQGWLQAFISTLTSSFTTACCPGPVLSGNKSAIIRTYFDIDVIGQWHEILWESWHAVYHAILHLIHFMKYNKETKITIKRLTFVL